MKTYGDMVVIFFHFQLGQETEGPACFSLSKEVLLLVGKEAE
jgi:hypothetical protein